MTQENKEILLKDLYGRLPYVTMCTTTDNDGSLPNIWKIVKADMINEDFFLIHDSHEAYRTVDVKEVKPYLFPLSSMTEEQYESLRESGILSNCSHSYEYVNPHIHGVSFIFKEFKTYSLQLIEYLNKNHFDYRGLIPMGLAIDCTNLNIY